MTTVQNFKGDDLELKMRAAAEPALELTENALNDFYENGEQSSPFLLMLYDEGRMPFSSRIPRDVFINFFRKMVENFPFVGNFESYLFILREIFGAESEILFEVPAPGKLNISVNAISDVIYEALARELVSGSYSFFNIATQDGDDLLFRGLAGIDTEHELSLLFAEIMPGGIVPGISLEFFTKSTFIGEDDSGVFDVIDSSGNDLIFIEIGG